MGAQSSPRTLEALHLSQLSQTVPPARGQAQGLDMQGFETTRQRVQLSLLGPLVATLHTGESPAQSSKLPPGPELTNTA